jgi:hypothetical protein
MKNKKLFASSLIIVVTLTFLIYQKVLAANVPALKEGTFLRDKL